MPVDLSMQSMWLWLGIILAFAEFIVPGLVVIFVGLGALTVALLISVGLIESLPAQFATWFATSIVYTLFLRMLVLRFYPTDTVKQNIDDITQDIGRRVRVIEKISGTTPGRIEHRESTWMAILPKGEEASPGEEVTITCRDQLTWTVDTTRKKENES